MNYNMIETMLLEIRSQKVLLDSDVSILYNVEVKRISEAVNNNPHKFPEGYVIELSSIEWESLRSKFSTLKNKGRGKHRKYLPKAFTEKGLYMLATILRSKEATITTILIIETYAKMREVAKNLNSLAQNADKEQQQSLMKRSSQLISKVLDENLEFDSSETTIELNFAVLKLKHTIKKTDK